MGSCSTSGFTATVSVGSPPPRLSASHAE